MTALNPDNCMMPNPGDEHAAGEVPLKPDPAAMLAKYKNVDLRSDWEAADELYAALAVSIAETAETTRRLETALTDNSQLVQEHNILVAEVNEMTRRLEAATKAMRDYLEWGAMTNSDRHLFEQRFGRLLAEAGDATQGGDR